MRSTLRSIALVATLALVMATAATARPRLMLVLSPDGGFHPKNKEPVKLPNGKTVDPPNLNGVAREMIGGVRKGGRIEVAMYAFSDMKALDEMTDRAREGVAVRMVLDACAGWTTDLRKMVYKELKKQTKDAKKAGDPFDFQVKEIPCDKFVDHGRSKILRDGKQITGTMHEKFGVFFEPRRRMPSHGFAGSSNFAKSAATLYAENRTFFWNDPVSAAQLHEEFERLWKYWGECSFGGPCEKVGKIRNVEAGRSGIKMVFNGECQEGGDCGDPAKVKRFRRIDREIEKQLEKVKPRGGTIDFTMFSFTHWRLKNKLLELADRYPRAKVRVLLDLSMMADDNPDRPGVLGPMMEKEAREKGLKNFEVRYKWRSNAHAYDPQNEKVPPGLYHFKSHLLHHKMVIVNRDVVVNGSYNWSGGAERRNLENIQVFERDRPGHSEVIDAFVREFDYLWNAPGPKDTPRDSYRPNPMVIGGPAGRQLQKDIVKVLEMKGAREVQFAMDEKYWIPKTVADVAKAAGLSKARTKRILEEMRKVTLLRRTDNGKYQLVD